MFAHLLSNAKTFTTKSSAHAKRRSTLSQEHEQHEGGRRHGSHFRQPDSQPPASGKFWSTSGSQGNSSLDDTDAFLEAARISQEARKKRAASQPAQLPETTTTHHEPTPEPEPTYTPTYERPRRATSSRRKSHAVKPLPPAQSVYEDKPRKRGFRPIHAVIIAVILLIVGAGTAAALYVSHINNKLAEKVTPELKQELVQKEAGDPFYLLLLGIDKDQSRWEGDDAADYGSDNSYYRSDSIMLCRIDPKNVKVTMVSIHRDTMIDMGQYGIQKINSAYSYGGPAYSTQVVSDFAGVDISHYAEIDLDRFIEVVEKVGGVTVTLPVPVKDPEYTGLNLPAGTQTLDGRTAALLCRCRHGYDDYGDGDKFRAANQRMVFSEVIKKVLKSDPATMMSTIASMAESVSTDLDVAAILDLANQMKTLNVDTDIMTGMEPTEGVLINETWYEMCIEDQWQKMMKRVDQGLPPYDVKEGEYDSTAGIAGGVGKEGQQAASNAVAADNAAASNGQSAQEQAPAQAQPSEEYVEEYYEEWYE